MKEFKPFRLDAVNHVLLRVSEEGMTQPVAITAKAFDVLRYFVEHPGRLVTHEELLEALWSGVAVQPEVLKGHVLAIRSALNDDAHRPRFLETQRGRGYRFIASVESAAGYPAEALPQAVPLVGRDEPWGRLRSCFDRASRGVSQTIFVRGEAGIGKTALVENFCREAGSKSALMSYGRCIEGFGGVEPFYPVIEALSRWVKGPEGTRVQDALVSHAPSWAALLGGLISRERRTMLMRTQGIAARGRVLGEFCELLEFLSEAGPLVLWLEDVHWADFSTLDLISALSRRQAHSQVMLICTVRMDDVSERASALKQLTDDLHLHHLCSVIDLHGLRDQDVVEYLGADIPGQPLGLATSLHHRSGGNPLFLGIILDHLKSVGRVTHSGGRWFLGAASTEVTETIPPTINELVESKIAKIGEQGRRALEAASAVGEAFNARVPATAAGMSAGQFEDICESLSRSGDFIRRQNDEVAGSGERLRVYAFKHSLYREVFLSRQGPLRLAQSHALIARQLELSYAADAQLHAPFQLAEQFASAHDWSKAISYLKLAVQTAKRRFAHQDALTVLDEADRVVLRLPDESRAASQLELTEDRASIYAASHDRGALDIFTRLAHDARTLDRPDVQARAELGRAFCLSWTDVQASVVHLEVAHALAEHQSNAQLRARVRLASAVWRIWIAGWTRELSDACSVNLRPLRNGGDRQVTAWGLMEYSMACLVSSRYREALETIEENLQILITHAIDRPEFNVFRAIWMAHLGRPWAHIMLGDWERALKEFDASEALFVANANRYSICALETLRGLLHLLAGDYHGVRAVCEKLGFYGQADPGTAPSLYTLVLPNEIRHCTLLAGAAEVALGDVLAGTERLTRLRQEMLDRPVILDWYWQFLLLWALGDASLRLGRLDDARAFADEMVRTAMTMEEGTWQTMALALGAHVAIKQGDLDAAGALVSRGMDVINSLGAPVAEWRLHKVGGELYRLLGMHELAEQQGALFELATNRPANSLPEHHPLRAAFLRMATEA